VSVGRRSRAGDADGVTVQRFSALFKISVPEKEGSMFPSPTLAAAYERDREQFGTDARLNSDTWLLVLRDWTAENSVERYGGCNYARLMSCRRAERRFEGVVKDGFEEV